MRSVYCFVICNMGALGDAVAIVHVCVGRVQTQKEDEAKEQ